MDYQQFKILASGHETGNTDSTASLQELLDEYPYFQTARLLYTKNLHDQDSLRYEKELKLASAYAGDRTVLFRLIHHRPAPAAKVHSLEESIPDSPFVPEENIPIPEVLIPEGPGQVLFSESFVIEEEQETGNQYDSVFPGGIPDESHDQPHTISSSHSDESKDENSYPPEAYSEAEISGDAFLAKEPEGQILDPQERIRRRLEEILGVNNSRQQETEKLKEAETDAQVENKIEIDSNLSAVAEEKENPPGHTSEQLHLDKTTPAEKPDEAQEIISRETKKPLDEIEKGELEHALEETILLSLERLPEIPAEQKTEPVARQGYISATSLKKSGHTESAVPATFFDWLKQKSDGQFGNIEEVHGDQEEITANEKVIIPERKTIIAGKIDLVPGHPVLPEKSLSGAKEEKETEHPSEQDLIDRFIATEPKILPSRAEFYSPVNQAKKSLMEHDDLVSETLARIYASQGNLLKARSSYEKLSLLHPEKRAYFAALIQEIDEQFNRQKEDL